MSRAELYRQELANRKNSVLDLLKKTEDFFRAYDTDTADRFNQLQQDLEQEEFTIVVVGEFSSGKSTLLNALMHRDCLPRKATATTATVNFLKHIDKAPDGRAFWVYYNDPNKEPQALELTDNSLREFVTAQSKMDVSKEINRVELYLDSKFLEDNVTLVDSPGLNALAEGHKEITENQIKKSHACIFLFDKTTETQFNFLRNLQESIDRVFILRNRIDEMDPSEVDEVLEDLKKSYGKVFANKMDTDIKVYGISAKLALEARTKSELSPEERDRRLKNSRIEEFETRLWEFLTYGEKTLDIMTAPVKKTISELERYRQRLAGEREMLSNVCDTDDLQKEIERLKDEKEKISAEYNQKRQYVLLLLQKKHGEFNGSVDKVEERISSMYSQEIGEWDGLGDMEENVRDFERRLTRDYQRGIEIELQRMKDDIFQEVVTLVSDNLEAIFQGLDARPGLTLGDVPHVDIQNIIREHGIEKYQEEREKIELEISKLAAEEEKVSDNIFRYRKTQRKREELEDEIKRINGKIEYMESPDYPIPSPRREWRDVPKTRDRRGIGGKIAQIFVGKKEFTESELFIDDSEHQAALAARKEKIGKYEVDLNNLEEKLNSIPEDDGECELRKRRLERQIRDKEDERNKLIQEFTEKYQQENAQSIKALKRRLEDHLYEVGADVKCKLNQYLQEERRIQADVITDQMTATINKILEKNSQQIAKLQEAVKSSDAEKNEKIAIIDQQITTLDPLLKSAYDLDSEIAIIS